MFSLPNLPVSRRPPSNRDLLTWLAIVLALGVLACDEEKALTAPLAAEPHSPGTTAPIGENVSAMGTIPLPINQTFNGGLAFGITQTGTGRVGLFRINNSSSSANALDVVTNAGSFPVPAAVLARATGRATAGRFMITNTENPLPAIEATTTGSGSAGHFQKNGPPGAGAALTAINLGRGFAGFFNSHRGTSLHAESEAGIAATFTSHTGQPVVEISAGNPPGGTFNSNALDVSVEDGATGWAAFFTGSSRGVMIMTNPGGTGLQVVNGSKNAVVGTTTGARALYSEEATEVWFADYGFGKLANGRARILIDAGFAQTVSLDEPYHVFVQPYGDAEVYVKERTNLGFVVMVRSGDPSIEFGYRVVAKRKGFETARLERAPWADNSFGSQAH
jgi:hypothetical protein